MINCSRTRNTTILYTPLIFFDSCVLFRLDSEVEYALCSDSHVIQGIDQDSDGVIDSVEMLE